jgi:multidrug efflux pump
MNFSAPFIRRPVATTLLAIGLFLIGVVAYVFLPVASLPRVDFPTIHVSAGRPGADPATMAATVAAPLERRLAEIAGVTEITSVSSLGSSSISIQFDIDRDIDGAARDVQAAINAAAADLPGDLPTSPIVRKSNPADTPILILALTSSTLPASTIYDAADTVVAQRIAQVEGVAEVTVSGAEQPAMRVRLDPVALANMGIGLDQVQKAIVSANTAGPLGVYDGGSKAGTIATNDQLKTIDDYRSVVVTTKSGTVVKLSAIADIAPGVRNRLMAGWYNKQPAVLIIVFKQASANVIETVDGILHLLPELKSWIPAGVDISVLSDRTGTIRASVNHLQLTIAATIALVMMVILLFLRRLAPTLAAGATVPLSLAGTLAAMWAVGYSIDNLSLMALTISVGFVVDDAIVMIENIYRELERGLPPLAAALAGARQIGFTVISISVSLIAAFIPILFMSGVIGRLFQEFSMTLTFAIAVSAVVSLTVTPMICGRFARHSPAADANVLDRLAEPALARVTALYALGLRWALRHRVFMLFVTLGTVVATVWLYVSAPKGFFPQDDTGLIFTITEASPDTSFQRMKVLQQRVAETILGDPAVARLGSFVGSSGGNASSNQGRIFVSLKPLDQRRASVFRVIDRLRPKLAAIPGISVFMVPAQDLRVGARSSKSQYQFTLWGSDLAQIQHYLPLVLANLRAIPGLVDVSTDREQGGIQLNVAVDRTAASRYGVTMQAVDDALNNAFAQRQVSTIYTSRNQYKIILEVDSELQRDPAALQRIYVTGTGGTQVPLASVTRIERGATPLVVNHQGQFPSVTITYNLKQGVSLDAARAAILEAVDGLHMPDSIHAEFSGNAQAFAQTLRDEPLLIAAALVTIYIVLGVLYESLLHPLTIISTLPSAGIGALLALRAAGTDLTIIAIIGIILLMGIVKKNGIMLVDFALEAERKEGMSPEQAIYRACIARFRPITMTSLAALFGAIPLVIGSGAGAELRRPLGLTIIGGMIVSQLLTIYTTPVIYLLVDRLRRRPRGAAHAAALSPAPPG